MGIVKSQFLPSFCHFICLFSLFFFSVYRFIILTQSLNQSHIDCFLLCSRRSGLLNSSVPAFFGSLRGEASLIDGVASQQGTDIIGKQL